MRLWRKRTHGGFLPVFFSSIPTAFRLILLKMLIVVAAPIFALIWFGQPALLFQYWWHGSPSYPVYEKCLYIALDGWHVVFPDYRVTPRICPTIRLLPVDVLKLLLG